ncbi:MAG: transposase [Crocinitomicaceae bacterium]
MSEKYKVIDSSIPTFITLTFVDWLDLLTRSKYTEILDKSLKYCQANKGLKVHCFVYMTNHIHLIVSSDDKEINEIVRDFKKFTNKRFVEQMKEAGESRRIWMLNKFAYKAQSTSRAEQYKIWKDGFHPVILDSPKKIMQRFNYIHNNPVKAGFVYHQRDWRNSSYRVYEEDSNLHCNIKIDRLF